MNVKQKSDTIIREAHANDIGTFKELYAQLSPDITNLDEDFPRKKMVIEDIVIDSQSCRRGFGSLLMHHCMDMARHEDLDCVELTCALSKTNLHRFYEKM